MPPREAPVTVSSDSMPSFARKARWTRTRSATVSSGKRDPYGRPDSGSIDDGPVRERQGHPERDRLVLPPELPPEERGRAESQRQEDVAIERVTDRGAERDTERQVPRADGREDGGLHRLADREGDHAGDGDL